MAGHSKWANIQHRKGRQDAKRGKLFTKLIRELTIAAKLGGGDDPNSNPRLRTAIDNAKSQSLPRDTMERAIKRGVSGDVGDNVEDMRYEGYGPGGAAILVDTLTDNRNRTVAEVRHIFSKFNGNLGTDGSVAYLFSKVGLLSYPSDADEDTIMDIALEAGADDIIHNDDSVDVLTPAEYFMDVREKLVAVGLEPNSAEITMYAPNSVALDVKNAETILRLLDGLEDIDDVQKVYSNVAISDAVLSQLD